MIMRVRRTDARTVEVEVDGDVKLAVQVTPEEDVRLNSRLLARPDAAAARA